MYICVHISSAGDVLELRIGLRAAGSGTGPLPARDRSGSAPRSVALRLEIGRVPRRDCGVSGHLRQGWVSVSAWRSGGVVLGIGGCVSRAAPSRAGSTGARVCRAWRVLHTCARSVSAETAESCRTAMPVVATVGLPCAQTPLTAHGSPSAAHKVHHRSPQFQQKPARAPQRPQSPMCNTEDNHAPHHQPNPTPPRIQRTNTVSDVLTTTLRVEIGPAPEHAFGARSGTGPYSRLLGQWIAVLA